jgi:hypothetical protein
MKVSKIDSSLCQHHPQKVCNFFGISKLRLATFRNDHQSLFEPLAHVLAPVLISIPFHFSDWVQPIVA